MILRILFKETNEQTKQKPKNLTDRDKIGGFQGEGDGEDQIYGDDGNQTIGSQQTIVYTDIKLQCCTPKSQVMLLPYVNLRIFKNSFSAVIMYCVNYFKSLLWIDILQNNNTEGR